MYCMNLPSKPRQTLSVVARGRRLKGEKMGRYLSLPLDVCEQIDLNVGDLVEIEVKKITKRAVQEA